MRSLRRPLFVLLGLIALSGCATRPPASEPEALAEYEQNNDPLEPFNRAMYDVQEGLDTVLLRPAAQVYRFVIPQPVRGGIRNVLANLRSPVILLNDGLQGETQRFGTTLGRFLLNTTIGIGGIFDVAKELGLPAHNEDFGQTLAVWGVGEGPYLFLPIIGPSNPRDLTGFGVDIAANPVTWVVANGDNTLENLGYIRLGLTVLDTREGLLDTLDNVNATSLDPYATLRSAYRQRRQNEIRNDRSAPAAASGTGFGAGPGLEASGD